VICPQDVFITTNVNMVGVLACYVLIEAQTANWLPIVNTGVACGIREVNQLVDAKCTTIVIQPKEKPVANGITRVVTDVERYPICMGVAWSFVMIVPDGRAWERKTGPDNREHDLDSVVFDASTTQNIRYLPCITPASHRGIQMEIGVMEQLVCCGRAILRLCRQVGRSREVERRQGHHGRVSWMRAQHSG
jgi:hypothetical protein